LSSPEQSVIDSTEKPGSLAAGWIAGLGLFGLLLVLAGISYSYARETGESAPKWIAGALLLFGLAYLWRITSQTLDVIKFGRIRLHLRVIPAAVGGVLDGELEFPKKAASLGRVVATLACVRVKWHATGGSGSIRSQEDIWTAYKQLELVVRGARGRAAFRFDVPADQPDSKASSSIGGFVRVAETINHGWELRVKAAAPGLDLERRFRINVAAAARD
jgi:hypothetical protein